MFPFWNDPAKYWIMRRHLVPLLLTALLAAMPGTPRAETGVPPRIDPIPNATIQENTTYSATKPVLSQGTPPITWSLAGPPSGMRVDAQTGQVTWPKAVYQSQPYRIRLRASNALGTGEASWTLTVTALSGPITRALPFAKGSQTTITWTAAPLAASYTVQRNDTPDFTSPQGTAMVSSTTLNRGFQGLDGNRTYWYRVRVNRKYPLSSIWSNVTSCTQDSAPPQVWMGFNDHAGEWVPVATARLFLSAREPGSVPSGIHQMRFSLDRMKWSEWVSFRPRESVWVGRAGTIPVYAQVKDQVGNIGEAWKTVKTEWVPAIYVNDDNTTGPWNGTVEFPFRNISDAIGAAPYRSTILVAPGIYSPINIDRDVVLRSADPLAPTIVQSTIIDGKNQSQVVIFKNTLTAQCKLAGFTVCNGLAVISGGGINGNSSSASIIHNIIRDNSVAGNAWSMGDIIDGWVYYYEARGGGAINCKGLIKNNTFFNNRVGTQPPSWSRGKPDQVPPTPNPRYEYNVYGAALYECNGPIINNTFIGNSGGRCLAYCNGAIRNNILPDVPILSSSLEYCFLNDPGAKFENGYYRLLPDSPCIDAGGFTGELRDGEGDARGFDGTSIKRGDGSDFDIGADEYEPLDQALWVMEPAGGGTLRGGEEITVHWHSDPARAGTAVWVMLWHGRNGVETLGRFESAPSGEGTCRVRLTNVAGTDHRIRVVSAQDATIVSQTPPFTMIKVNAAPRASWKQYR